MANESTAYGSIIIRSKDKKTVQAVYGAMARYAGDWDYWTELVDPVEEGVMPEDMEPRYIRGKYEMLAEFNGCGRWNYERNAQAMVQWLDESLEQSSTPAGMKELWRYAMARGFEIWYTFSDTDPGMLMLYHETAVLEHKAGEPAEYKDGQFRVLSSQDYDYNKENFELLGFDWEAIEEE